METRKASTYIFIDKYHPKKDGKCKISICVTFDRRKRYFPTPIELTAEEYGKTVSLKPKREYKEILLKMQAYEQKASDIIKNLPLFNWPDFELHYYRDRGAREYIFEAFTEYANKLREEGRIGTAVSYECARNSFCKFAPDSKFTDVNVDLLKRYERWMLESGGSITTVGIYLRSLRTLFNLQNMPKELYPFGKRKYEIPTGRNKKKAVGIKEIARIYNYEAKKDSSLAMARDLWIFMYLCNGINVKDLCLLKFNNIKGDVLEFYRAKTIKTKREVESIRIPLSEEAKRVIDRWGNEVKAPDNYIFPILKKGLSPERQRDLIQLITKLINKKLNIIRKCLDLDLPLTTYSARHSFATILQRNGVSISFISESLGHGSIRTTQSYLAGFEDETKKETLKALTSFIII